MKAPVAHRLDHQFSELAQRQGEVVLLLEFLMKPLAQFGKGRLIDRGQQSHVVCLFTRASGPRPGSG